MECFLQFIVDNFDHNEDTTTGVCTTHVMGLICSWYPKSNTFLTQPIMKQTITSAKMIDLANVKGLVKMYEKPSISKFKKMFVKACDPSQPDTSLYDILDAFWLLSSSFMDKPPNWQGFMADIIHETPVPLQIQFRPVIPLDLSSYEAVYSTLFFVNEEIKKKSMCCTSLTFDQPLYWKAEEIKADKSPEFNSIYLKLGGFHQLMSFLRAGCKLMEDAGLKELWSTIYQENSLPKMIEGKPYSRCLRAVLLTDSALHFSLLSTKEMQDTESDERVFEPTDMFHKSGDVQDGNIFKTLCDIKDLESYDNGDDSEDAKSIADKLTEALRNNFSDDPLLIFNKDIIKQLNELYESLSLKQCNPDAAVNQNIVSMVHEKLSNLKFIHDAKRTGKLWIQFMDFASIVRMFI